MYSTFEHIEISSSDEEDSSSDENHDIVDQNQRFFQQRKFLNQTSLQEYEKNRDKLFTKDILKKRVVIDSHNYFQTSDFNTSNFLINFDLETDAGSSTVTTNYDIYHNVIGFRLVRTTIRTPPYNVNSTNNVIKYKRTGDNTIHTVTINPGVYNITELANVFQTFHGSLFAATDDAPTATVNTANYAQFITYTDNALPGSYNVSSSPKFTPGYNTISVLFHDNDSTTSISTNGKKGMVFEFKLNAEDTITEEITILWDYNNITRGAARLFGFIPQETISSSQKIFSNRTPDLSSHFVDLVIPEIPSIGCKRNSSGRDIIERIQLSAGHGEYLHYSINVDESSSQHYFAPITLHRLNIQLYAVNNVLYDTNNSDNSFEFEMTMVKNKQLLT